MKDYYEILENPMAGVMSDIRNQNDDLSTEKVEAYEESGEFPPDVEFVELETDVGWYGRHARKILRDQVSSFLVPQQVLRY